MCAGRTGQLLNLEGLGNDAGVSHATAREWLSLLEASYVAFRLQPFARNVSKRLVKTPKLYFYDVGLAAYLMGVGSADQDSAGSPDRELEDIRPGAGRGGAEGGLGAGIVKQTSTGKVTWHSLRKTYASA